MLFIHVRILAGVQFCFNLLLLCPGLFIESLGIDYHATAHCLWDKHPIVGGILVVVIPRRTFEAQEQSVVLQDTPLLDL